MGEMNYHLQDTLQKGFFTVNPNFQSEIDSKHYETLFLTNGLNTTLKDRILTSIREANSVVKLCSFIVTDEEIVNEILLKVQDPNIAVFLLTQLDQKKLKNIFNNYKWILLIIHNQLIMIIRNIR